MTDRRRSNRQRGVPPPLIGYGAPPSPGGGPVRPRDGSVMDTGGQEVPSLAYLAARGLPDAIQLVAELDARERELTRREAAQADDDDDSAESSLYEAISGLGLGPDDNLLQQCLQEMSAQPQMREQQHATNILNTWRCFVPPCNFPK